MSTKQAVEEIEHHLHSYERWMEPAASPSSSAPELIVNGDFAADSDWTKSGGTTISGGFANIPTNGLLNQDNVPATEEDAEYTLVVVVLDYPIWVYIKSIEAIPVTLYSGNCPVGTTTVNFTTKDTAGVGILFDNGGGAGTVRIDSVSIKKEAESHVADRFGSRKTSAVTFQLDAGNNDWGSWVQVLGSEDTPVIADKAYFDLHRILFVASERNALYALQFAYGTSAAQALSDETYSEVPYRPITTGGDAFPMPKQMNRRAAGTKVWARCMCPGQNTATVDFIYGIHEYDEDSTGYVETSVTSIANNAITAAAIADAAIDKATFAADIMTGNNLNCESKVTAAPTDMATATNQTTILNRIGAFTGTGINTILGFFKALMSKTATKPSDLDSETYDPTFFSTEGQTIANAANFQDLAGGQEVILNAISAGFADTLDVNVVSVNGETTSGIQTIALGADDKVILSNEQYPNLLTTAKYLDFQNKLVKSRTLLKNPEQYEIGTGTAKKTINVVYEAFGGVEKVLSESVS